MEQIEYLYNNYREPTPDWLMEINRDSEIPWNQFFESRTVFYPGAGMDPHTVDVFGGAHCAHCFINVDYLVMKTEIEAKTREYSFSGEKLDADKALFPDYTRIYSRSLSEGEFFAMFRNPYSYRSAPDLQRFNSRSEFDRYEHFVKFYVFERNANCINPHSVERFALLYLGADAFPVFNTVYVQGRANLFASLIEDYGYGCQYERFGNRQLLHEMAKKANVFSEFILSNNGCHVWKHYTLIEGVEMSRGVRFERWLYKVDKEAFRLEAEFRDYQYKFFLHDFEKRFKVERRAGEDCVNFVDADFAHFSQKLDVRSIDPQSLNFLAACFFNFLIPQIFGKLGGRSAYYDYARATGWPVLEYGSPMEQSSAQVLFKAGLIPAECNIASFCKILEVLKEYFAENLEEFFCGRLHTLNDAAYARLCQNRELRGSSVNEQLRSRTDEFVQSLKGMYK